MPIKTQNDLPVKEILERENIFVMDENRASHQNIRQLEIAIVNLMPLKEDTELQILRSLSNTPIQVNVTFVTTSTHEATHTSLSHLNKFYETFDDIKDRYFDGMIITGAPVELMEYEEVDYWDEICSIMEWSEDTCFLYTSSVLGCTGRIVLSLRHTKACTSKEEVWCVCAPRKEQKNPTCQRLR